MSQLVRKCPVCYSRKYTQPYTIRGHTYHCCSSCGTLYLSEEGNTLSGSNHYDDAYFTSAVKDNLSGYMDYKNQSYPFRKNFRILLLHILRYISLDTPKSLLDVGCAYGFFLDEARKLGMSVQGLDLSESAIKWMEKNLGIKGTVGFSYNAPEGPFDVITAIEVIEHIRDPHSFILDLYNRMNNGGILMIHTGACDTLAAKLLGKRWWYLNPPDHIVIFSKIALRKIILDAGFDVLEHRITTHYWVGLNNIFLKLARILESKRLGLLASKLPAVFAPVFHFTTQLLIARKR